MTAAELRALSVALKPGSPVTIKAEDAERFAELLERDEIGPKWSGRKYSYASEPTGEYWWSARNPTQFFWHVGEQSGWVDTEAEARAAVEDAVRAGR